MFENKQFNYQKAKSEFIIIKTKETNITGYRLYGHEPMV